MEIVIEWVLSLAGIYLTTGLLFALPFVLCGVKKIDPSARDGTWGFKVMIIPGAMVFWPLLLSRWVRRLPPPEERSAHRPGVND